MKREPKAHYVNNKEFSHAVVEYVNAANQAKETGEDVPIITEYIGTCFLKIAEGLSHKPNFSSYTYREEMVMDAVENCIKAINNYDVTKTTRTGNPNAFAYFTQISYYAFLRRIQKEKKHQDIKELYIEHAGIESFGDFDNTDLGQSIVEKFRKKIKRKSEDNREKPLEKFMK
jgi:hypothetical protein